MEKKEFLLKDESGIIIDNKKNKLRLDYLDYAKGFGILLIMFGHVVQYFSNIASIKSFFVYQVSIFFVVSGALFFITDSKNIEFIPYLRKKFKSLIIPYIIFSFINSVLKLGVLLCLKKINVQAVKDEMTALFITGNGTVWFLLTLFLVEISFYFIYKLKKDIYKYILGVVFAVIPFLITSENSFLILILRVPLALGYYIFGYWLIKTIRQYKIKNIPLYLGIIFIGIGMFLSRFGIDEGYFGGDYNNIFFTIPSNLFNICGFIIIFMWIKIKIKSLSYFGKNSLIIMLIHPTILLFFTYPLAKLFDRLNFSMQLIVCISIYIFIVLAQIPFIYLINRYVPFIIGKNKNKAMAGNS